MSAAAVVVPCIADTIASFVYTISTTFNGAALIVTFTDSRAHTTATTATGSPSIRILGSITTRTLVGMFTARTLVPTLVPGTLLYGFGRAQFPPGCVGIFFFFENVFERGFFQHDCAIGCIV